MVHPFGGFGLGRLASASLDFSLQTQSRPPEGSARTRDIYVSVVDSKGVPVPGLSAADFVVREDGSAREVLKAGPATAPMQIIVLIDDSEAATNAIQRIREGLTAFVDKLQGRAEIGLVTTGERPTSLVQYTTDTAALKKGINRLFARPGAGAYLLEGIQEVSRGLEKREAARPVIVALTTEGVEFSNLQHDQVLKQLQASGAAFHVVAIGMPSSSMSDEMRNRNVVLAEGTERTGGRRDQLLAESSIPEALPRVANELLNQYVVTYGRPETLIPPEKIQVSVSRPGLTVRARTRTAGR
jgi:Ca-activated chloride channel family protein